MQWFVKPLELKLKVYTSITFQILMDPTVNTFLLYKGTLTILYYS